jgi:hypothetical protein
MIELVHAEQLSRDSAIEVAQAIHRINPRYITPEILERFEAELV